MPCLKTRLNKSLKQNDREMDRKAERCKQKRYGNEEKERYVPEWQRDRKIDR